MEPGVYQLTYPQQFIYINFKQSLIPGSKKYFRPAELNENERNFILNALKEQIDLLPSAFITKYLNIYIHPFHIINGNNYGFYYENQIVVDIDKIKPGLSYKQSITSSFIHELAYLVLERQRRSNETQAFKEYLKDYYERYWFSDRENKTGSYHNGFVSERPAGTNGHGYSATDEIAELFSHLICLESREVLFQFMESNPKSILGKKINRFMAYLESAFPSLNSAYFFGEPVNIEYDTTPETGLNEDQLLISHELKSYESYDFSNNSENEDYEFTSRSNSQYSEFSDLQDEFEFTAQSENKEDQIETIFHSDSNKKRKEKKKKTKRKKDGTGLLIVGGLLYLTLELLSQ